MNLIKQELVSSEEPKIYSLEAYFELEYNSKTRHEFHNGTIVACAHTSENHNQVVANLNQILETCLEETDFAIFTSDQMVYAASCNDVFYPDLMLVYGERQYHQYSRNKKATTNPSVLIEIVSDVTASINRGEKLQCYRRFKSLQQYILIEPDYRMIEVFEIDEHKRWTANIYKKDEDIIEIEDNEILLKDIYLNVKLTESDTEIEEE